MAEFEGNMRGKWVKSGWEDRASKVIYHKTGAPS